MARKLFCEWHPMCYWISEEKEIARRHLKNRLSQVKFAKIRQTESLPHLIYSHSSSMIKRAPGVDPVSQENKAVNIRLASSKIHGILIRPGETFSFWQLVGKTSKGRGFRAGRILVKNKLQLGVGGGLCNLANTIHLLVLHSPLTVTEFHGHSDALAPDEHGRVPFSAGTSVKYNYVDYRFRNDTDQDIQLLTWCQDDISYAQLRSQTPFPLTYRLTEEGHHFRKEGDKFYRISKIYKNTLDTATGKLLRKELVLDNHSEVLFDYSLIPPEQIRED